MENETRREDFVIIAFSSEPKLALRVNLFVPLRLEKLLNESILLSLGLLLRALSFHGGNGLGGVDNPRVANFLEVWGVMALSLSGSSYDDPAE